VAADVYEGAEDTTVDVAKTTGSGAKKIGEYTVNVTEGVVGQTYEGGKWLVHTSWDGTKWVGKRVWYPNKKP